MKNYHLLFCAMLITFQMGAQKKNESFRLNIRKATSAIVIDGVGDDLAWKDTDVADDFFMVLPMDEGKANEKTEIRMAYDDKNLYLIATFFNNTPGPYYVESLRRDFSFGKNDNFLLFMDPYNNQTTGFSFGSNAAGAQWDGTMYEGGKVDLNWDSKWVSKVKQDEDKWVFEMSVPFKSIRYKEGVKEWGINFSRLDLGSSEKSSWTPIPRQFPTASLAYTGVLVWDNPPPSPGTNISVIPYVLGGYSENLEGENTFEKKIGGDVKVSLTSSLNLDLTVNPDFSQVEVDRQVTNLDRFELFFPEKRQFFLENADLFANFGYATIRPFFSRRIGLEAPIRGGARISGNINEKWRLGLMDMQTGRVEDMGLPNQNFGVVSLQRKVFSRSSIGLILVNMQSFNYPENPELIENIPQEFNRNLGVEYNLASANNLWNGKAFLLKSFSPTAEGDGISQAAHLEYKSRKWKWRIQEESVGKSYKADVGFVPRNGYVNVKSYLGHLLIPKSGKILSHGPTLNTSYFFNEKLERTDNTNYLLYSFAFRNRSSLNFFVSDDYVELLSPFDPTRLGKEELGLGTEHHWNAYGWMFASKPQSLFTYTFDGRLGGYYEGGNRTSLTTELGYRFQPFISLSANLNYNRIELPSPWNTNQFWLIGSEADITFTNKLFFATLFQYNEQSKNFNLNSRFQWRYKPASDLFIVYTNNHLIAPYSGRTWSLTLKLNYWFNR
ncbi:MAG: carbohydrate binding family 9 domain-containing protein [Maribacter sp.]|nr:carbohydrate binding family 9 domain-containing protein [Maribacter sp.]